LIKQGAKLVATWEDVFEELPTEIRLLLQARSMQVPEPKAAGLFDDAPTPGLPEEQLQIFGAIKADVSTHIDELIERFEGRLTTSEIFTALFELEMVNKIRQLPGKNYVRVF
jgi:DNA processing protein